MARNGTTPAEAIQLATDEINNQKEIIDQIKSIIFSKYPQLAPVSLNWEYTLDDSTNTIKLTRYIGENRDVIVYNEYKVDGRTYDNVVIKTSSDGWGPFMDTAITSVKFLEGVTVENNDMTNMFTRCSLLVKAPEIPAGVTNMTFAFRDCWSLVEAPVIPDSVTNMYMTFNSCTSLAIAQNIGENVTNLGGTFLNCTSLTTIKDPVIPAGVTNMIYTFQNCYALTGSLVINANPNEYDGVFYNCSTNEGTDLVLTGSSDMLEAFVWEGIYSGDENIRIA